MAKRVPDAGSYDPVSARKYWHRFALKGALLLIAWRAPQSPLTMDIDLEGRVSNQLDHIKQVVATYQYLCSGSPEFAVSNESRGPSHAVIVIDGSAAPWSKRPI